METTAEWTNETDRAPEQPEDGQPEDGQPDSTSELRAEAARYRRQRSELREQVEKLQQQLFTERVRSTGLMIDPADMPVNAELLDSPEELRQHVEEYLQQRPHLRRRQFPQIGVHEQGRAAGPSLADILRNHA